VQLQQQYTCYAWPALHVAAGPASCQQQLSDQHAWLQQDPAADCADCWHVYHCQIVACFLLKKR
jgi:hypothetical protein